MNAQVTCRAAGWLARVCAGLGAAILDAMRGVKVRRTPSVFRNTGTYVVVASVDGRCLELAGSAAMIWMAIPGPTEPPTSAAVLAENLSREHDVALDVVAADVALVIDALEKAGCATTFG